MFEPRLPRIVTAADLAAMRPADRLGWSVTPHDKAEKYRARIALETARMLRAAEYFLIGGKPWASADLTKARIYFNDEFGTTLGYFDADTGELVPLVRTTSRLTEHIEKLRAGPKPPPVFNLLRGDVCLLISAEVPERPHWDSRKNRGRIVVTGAPYTGCPAGSLPPCWFIVPNDDAPFLVSSKNWECEQSFLVAKESHLIPIGGGGKSLKPLPTIPPELTPELPE